MQSESSTQTDSSLLQRWCTERSQEAFTELVRRHEQLVLGAAVRRAGDPELAREVAQQVFTILAVKAQLLVGRPTIAGWLYRAASHVAAQLRRSDARRVVRHHSAALQHPTATPRDEWAILDEALGQLGPSDREALLLHYFQDLSYTEMASALGIAETAARKRVSRGLQKLASELRKHGLSSPKALLAAAAALQAAQPANAALAATALAGTATVSAPFTLILHALMSHLPIKIAVCAASLALLPVGYEWTTNANLHASLAEQQLHPAPRAQSAATASRDFPESGLADVRAELVRVETAARAAESRVAELSLYKDRLKDELVVSLGSVESMAKGLGATLRQMTDLQALQADTTRHPPDSPEWKKREAMMQEVQAGAPKIFAVLRELPRLERDPAKAARFYATLVAETAGLDDTERSLLEPRLQDWVSQLQRDSLALPQRPREPKEAIADWDKRRIAAMHDISKEMQALVPAAKAERASLLRALMIQPNEKANSEAFDIITGKKP